MNYVISYDIEEDKARDKLSQYLKMYGVRLHQSVFVIEIEKRLLEKIILEITKIVQKKGKVAIFPQCEGCKKSAIQLGNKKVKYLII